MEYPMGTLIADAYLPTVFHEWMHTWYQMLLATNESEYAWIDEGFTTYASTLVNAYYEQTKANKELRIENIPAEKRAAFLASFLAKIRADFPHNDAYKKYFNLAQSSLEEPLTTHADHFETNIAYGISSYSKGAVFMEQLGYIVGAAVRDSILIDYYRKWAFKHPNINDFMQIAENISGMKLDWYREYFVNTTKTIDYAIDSVWEEDGYTKVRMANYGKMPMPIDVKIYFKDGNAELHYVPMYLMFGAKPNEDLRIKRKEYKAWKWTDFYYTIQTNTKLSEIASIEIDPTQRMADINRKNNDYKQR
jgi:aminopeptidase N